MRKIFLSLAVFGTALCGASAADAGYGILPYKTTYRALATEAPLVVRAKLSEVVLTDVSAEGINPDHLLFRANAPENHHMRRDVVLNITKILSQTDGIGATLGDFKVISTEQKKFDQYPQSLQDGEEGIFFLQQRANGDWEFRGEVRGLLSKEDSAGNIDLAEDAVNDLIVARKGISGDGDFFAAAQDRLMEEVSRIDSRLAVDALIDFGWNFNSFSGHFDTEEKGTLLSLLEDTTSGTAMRRELITSLGRTLPDGGQEALVNMLATDTDASTTSLAAWALEQYGRGTSSTMLVDKYTTLTDDAERAAVIRGLGLIRPKSYRATEVSARNRFTEILRSTLVKGESSEVMTEALIAARDMRFVNNETNLELMQLILHFRSGEMTDESVYKRAIVAMAATRSEASREFLLEQKGNFQGNYDKHIDLALMMPFHTLVDYR